MIRSLASVPLLARGERIGAQNIHSTHLGRYGTTETLELAEVYAVRVVDTLSSGRRVSGREVAMGSRHVIGEAQGILIEPDHVDVDGAFAIVQRTSSVQNRTPLDVAAELVQTKRIEGMGLPSAGGPT